MLDYFQLNGIDLAANAAGVRMVSKVTGLFGTPSPRNDGVRDRPQADGQIEPVNMYFEPRLITLEGSVFPDASNSAYTNWRATQKAIWQAARQQKLATFRTTGSGLDLQAMVRLASPLQAEAVALGSQHSYEYQAIFRAADPLLYSQTLSAVSAASSVNVTNGGDADTWPLVTVHGPIIAPQIHNITQGLSVLFTMTLSSTQSLIVDFNPATRSATIAGSNFMGSLLYTASQFFDINAGATENITLSGSGGTSGATLLTVNWRNAYTT